MIKRIKINNIPPYSGEVQIIEPKFINFFFGMNGTGKTTISRYLRSPDLQIYNSCEMEWTDAPLYCAVYNRDFVTENFHESSIPGIFTLGEENIEIKRHIEGLTEEIRTLEAKRDSISEDLYGTDSTTGLHSKLQALEARYTEKFWCIKKLFDKEKSPINLALVGVRGSKEDFKATLLSQSEINKNELDSKETLENLCLQLYNNKAEMVERIAIPSFDALLNLETKNILQKIIVGKDDVDISALIRKLGNDTWFKQGTQYLNDSEGKCPFCQKPLDEDFAAKISAYFDETYISDVQEIEKLNNFYTQISDKILTEVRTLQEKFAQFLNGANLSEAIQQFETTVDANKRKLKEKMDAPSVAIQLDTLKGVTDCITECFNEANIAIAEYNNRIEHIKDEKVKLSSRVWRYILDLLSDEIETYKHDKEDLNNKISATTLELNGISDTIRTKQVELHDFEQRLTSVVPTANGINDLLRNYGFTCFSLEVDASEKSYRFVRENGEAAYNTLSEGERNFVTFLYFMYSLKGNIHESGHNENKVVIIDDPVSSLDNDILFIVSSLLRDLFANIYNGVGTIKQLFILSHNLYFFKEVSYEKGIKPNKTGYWMIIKNNNVSKVLSYDKNPVRSTYDMLWDDVRKANCDPARYSPLSLANTMRRILEYYFAFLGGKNLNQLHSEFPDGERQVFKSLISWANAGSHSVFDDYSATPNMYSVETHLKVFRDLFVKTQHLAHYNMMMGIDAEDHTNGQT